MKGFWKQWWHCLMRFHNPTNQYISGPPEYKDILTWRGCSCGKTFFGKEFRFDK